MYCMTGTEDYIRYSNEEKLTIIQIGDIEAYERLFDLGYRLVNVGVDVVGLKNYFLDFVGKIEEIKKSL